MVYAHILLPMPSLIASFAVLGVFARKQAVFLVIWELQIILELLPGGWILLPSALFTHLNVDAASKPILYTLCTFSPPDS